MLELQHTYNHPLRDKNVRKMSVEQWKAFVTNVIREEGLTLISNILVLALNTTLAKFG